MKLTGILSLALLLSAPSLAQKIPNITVERTDSLIHKWMSDTHTPGVALAVLQKDQPPAIKTYGLADVETNTPVTGQSVFMIASLSKQFISFSVLLLQQQGKLSLDDPAARYITELPAPLQTITIRQLLTHTSGLVRDPADYHPYDQQTLMDVIKAMYGIPLASAPGTIMRYSNAGYFMLAEIISRVSGESWDAFITKHLFTPAGMTSTRTGSFSEIIPNRVSGYNYNGKGLTNTERWIAVRPSGAFVSTITDMIKWDRYLDTTQALHPENRKLLWAPAKLNDGSQSNYAFGWYADSFLGTARIHHDGQYPGFRSDYERFPAEGLTVIVFTNLDNQALESLALKAAGIFDPKLSFPPFDIRIKLQANTAIVKTKTPIGLSVTDRGQAAPASVVEMEIWDENGQAVYKQQAENLDFVPQQAQQLHFNWTPAKPGKYTLNVGVYGPHWMFSYAWKMKLATIEVIAGHQ